MRSFRAVGAIGAVALAAAGLAACGGEAGGDTAEGDGTLTIWTLEDNPDRVAILEDIAADFGADAGVETAVVPVDAAQFNALLVSSAASGDLPDVMAALGLDGVGAMAANELLNTDAPAEIVDTLGVDTFNPAALDLATVDGTLLAVPSDSYPTVLFYRTDLFEAAGLDAPTDYDSIMAAAEELQGTGVTPFAGFTTEQGDFQGLALANGCELVQEDGTVTLDAPECVEAFTFYDDLITEHSFAGEQDWDAVRASYLSGQAAMAMYSSYLLDELAGQHENFVPSCPECAADPAFLAKNSGVVADIGGSDGMVRGQFRMQSDWAITVTADPEAADFVTYAMSDRYLDVLSMAPEGKVPDRLGTEENPTEYLDGWEALPIGTAKEQTLADFYPPDVLEALTNPEGDALWWGVRQGHAELLGAMLGELPVENAMNDMLTDANTPEEAAQQAAEQVREIQDSIG
ncbi:ABC transporter substrate-binding protein [Antribacter gilvus]|uniref:ABC transporter substrate-binding protein n=1 Tax=Antribacter gilvus TaxID=2304675 RepID=UPI000F78C998|nr:extracellular solute-binding protein [Antribacter gilvus]